MRGVLYNLDGKIKKINQVHYKPNYLENNHVEQEPSTWEKALIKVTAESVEWAKEHNKNILAVSITAQRSSIIPVNKDGKPLHNAIMWQDKRTFNICKEHNEYLNVIYNSTGSRINTVFSAPKIKWFKMYQPELYKNTFKMLSVADYLIFVMTENFSTDYTYGSRSLLMNIKTLEWDNDMIKLFNLDKEKLCTLVPQGQEIGKTTSNFEKQTKLPSGTPVISAGGDQQCAAIGAGVIDKGSLNITTGTGSFIVASSDYVKLDSQFRTTCNVSSIPGKYIIESSILTTSTICNWFSSNFYNLDENENTFSLKKMVDEAQNSPVGSNSVIFFPYFQGRGSPDWNTMATGMFYNISLKTERRDFARSIFEGIAMEISDNLDVMEEIIGEIESISISGGLTKSSLFNQIQTDVFNKTVTLPGNNETTSLGAWVSAAVSLGMYETYSEALKIANSDNELTIYSPLSENTGVYHKLKHAKQRLYQLLNKEEIYTAL